MNLVFGIATALMASSQAIPAPVSDTAFFCDLYPVIGAGSGQVDTTAPAKPLGVWYGRVPTEVGLARDDFGAVALLHDPSGVFPDKYRWQNKLPESFVVSGGEDWVRVMRFAPSSEGPAGTMRIDIVSMKMETKDKRRIKDRLRGACASDSMTLDDFYSETRK